MTTVEQADEIDARMDREVPAMDLHDRSDLRRVIAALRAVLDVLEGAASEYRATSDRMHRAVTNREAHDFGADDIVRYAAYAGAAEGAARRAREAITAALDPS